MKPMDKYYQFIIDNNFYILNWSFTETFPEKITCLSSKHQF